MSEVKETYHVVDMTNEEHTIEVKELSEEI